MINSGNGEYHARYTGPVERLYGETAIVRPTADPGTVLAQFDKPLYIGGANLAVGWHEFNVRSFTPE